MRSTQCPFNFQNCQRIRPLDNPKHISRVHGLWGKTCNRINCKGQLILYKGGSWLSELIVRSQRNQTFHQNKIQRNKNNSRTVSKRTLQHSLHHMELGTSRSTKQAYVITIAQCTPFGCKSCIGKKAQKMDSRGMETSCI